MNKPIYKLNKHLLFGLLFWILPSTFLGQGLNLSWVNAMGGTDRDVANDLIRDSGGNLYLTGVFVGTVDFDPGPDTLNLVGQGTAGDIFVQKLDPNGNLLWAHAFAVNAGSSPAFGQRLALDGSGNLLVTGVFTGNNVDFDPGPGQELKTANGENVFVMKLDGNGNFQWVATFDDNFKPRGWGIDTDASGNVYACGRFFGSTDFDPGSGTAIFTTPSTDGDAFVVKLDPSGNYAWAKTFGGLERDVARDVVVDQAGNAYVTGYFRGIVDFDPGPGTVSYTSGGDEDIFVIKLDPLGNLVWADAMSGPGLDLAYSLELDQHNNIYLTGIFSDSTDFDPGTGNFTLYSNGNYDFFVQKLRPNGDFVWAYGIGSSYGNFGDYSLALALDQHANVYTTGSIANSGQLSFSVDFDPGPGVFNLTAGISQDIFIQKVDSNGNFIYAELIRSSSGGGEFGRGIEVDNQQNVFVVGSFEGTADFNPGVDSILVSENGDGDAFIAKFTPCNNVFSSFNANVCSNQLPYQFGGQSIQTAGTYVQAFPASNGCDSVVTLNLTVNPTFSTNLSATTCDPAQVGTDTLVLTNQAGCDSLVITQTTLNSPSQTNLSATTCDPAQVGTDTLVLTNQAGCDSLLITSTSLLPSYSITDSVFICQGQSYFFAGQNLSVSGTYVDSLQTALACDSIVTLVLTVGNSVITNLNASFCQGESYLFAGQSLNQAGTYTDSLMGSSGCDSIVSLNLVVRQTDLVQLSATSCDSSLIGLDTLTLSNQFGCDSLVITQTTLSQSDTTHLSAEICDNESFNFQGQVLTQPGNYSQLLTNQEGCDSLLILDLTVFPTYDENLTITINAGDAYVFDGRSYSSDTMVTAIFTSAQGCDSVVNLILQVQQGQQNLIPPSNLRSTDTTLLLYTFAWQDNSNDEDGFLIYRNGLVYASTAADDTVFTDTILTFGQTFDYRVAAFRSNDTSSRSNAISYFLPATVQRLELSYICHEPDSNLLYWNVYNPNSQLIPYIFAQWWSPQRDTLLALPGNSEFITEVNPQDPATYGDDNITGIWWIDERLLPGRPNDIIFSIDLGLDCGSLRRVKNPLSPQAGDVFEGSLRRDISFERATSVEPPYLKENVSLWPNPFSGHINLKIRENKSNMSLNIFDLSGRLVFRRETLRGKEVELKLNELPAGIYTLQLRGKDFWYSRRISKIAGF